MTATSRGAARAPRQAWRPKAAEIVDALRAHYLPAADLAAGMEEWSMLTEVPSLGVPAPATPPPDSAAVDWSDPAARASAEQALEVWRQEQQTVRSIDVLLLRNWSSGRAGNTRLAVEVKVTRADFRRDTDAKRAPWLHLADQFAYCTPAGLLDPAEVPAGCGLIEVTAEPCAHPRHRPTRVHWRVRAPRTSRPPWPEALTVHLARLASRATEHLRVGVDADAVAELRRARRQIADLTTSLRTCRRTVREVAALVGPLHPQTCADCGAPIKATWSRYGAARWEHASEPEGCSALWGGIEPAALRAALAED